MDGDTLILQLHPWRAEEHPNLGDPDAAPRAHGVLLWFRVDELDHVYARANEMKADVLDAPHENPNAGHRESACATPTATR